MTYAFRRAIVGIVGVLACGWIVSACSGGSSQAGVPGAVGTSGQNEPAFVDLHVSSMFITIENRAAQPLLDVRVAIKPLGRPLPFTTTIPRLESSEKRDLSLSQLRGRDGTPFNLRVTRPEEITVTAVDLVGEKYEMTRPWER